ncbi:glycosyltransferase family 2 protein [Staphylococcus kloosii]|jgi:glycosyltransferase involved in cell wall biosynthesis|uniref:glycosyltransferase family 2 protein n=1 Tax=Staphylococcus kloosii TaxID=29384 RepID=UPI00189D03C2|nr:glycosyltransferase family 2 protein [Staphylococcus kloosii]MBF7029747.1 glycosyltransferase family 2 protein [Staphylococcus kloosii]
MKKVSVVIPSFNNEEKVLNRLVDSLNEQTMNEEDFDVIFVDDGSSDFQAYKRLKDVTDKHNNYFVHRISPSGWSSRPRNKGIALADSKYIFFCDDDDSIFPQALERIYNFAEENNLDVVNPKVIRTKGWSWGWEEYKENKINAQKDGVTCMGPMTVPKLYKKEFLVNNDLYFSEGEKVWWEDVMYSCLVYSKNPKIGIYTDYPIYHWREQNRSAGFGKDLQHKWNQLNNLAEFFNKHLKNDDRITMITHWYNSRVLGAIRKNFHTKNEETKETEFNFAREWRNKYVDKKVVERLDTRSKILDEILESNSQDLAEEYSKIKADITARSYIKNIEFNDNEILFTTEAAITYAEESDVYIKGSPRKPKLTLPESLENKLPKNLLHYNKIDSDDNMYLPALKGRFTRTTWDVKNIKNSEFIYNKSSEEKEYSVKGRLTFGLKLDDYLQDNVDYQQPYDIATRFSYLDYFSQRAVACKDKFKKTAIINGNTYLIYKNASELLSIDLNSTVKNFFEFSKIKTSEHEIMGYYIKLPLEVDHVYGTNSVDLLASIYNKKSDEFIETSAMLKTFNGKVHLEIHNPENLSGDLTIDIAHGKKSQRINLSI